MSETATHVETLPNGARLLQRGPLIVEGTCNDSFVCLATIGTDEIREYVTWLVVCPPKRDTFCVWGHYFKSHREALADFDRRVVRGY